MLSARSTRRTAFGPTLAGALSAALAACAGDPTQIVVTVALGDPSLTQGPGGDIDTVRISAGASGDAALTERTAALGPPGEGLRLPAALLAVTPRAGDPIAQVFIRAEGLNGGSIVASQSITETFSPGRRVDVVLPLFGRCVGAAACPPGQLCASDGSCQPGSTIDAGPPGDAPPVDASPGCATGLTPCNGACVDTATSAANCGSCGNACPAGSTCVAGGCQVSCPAGQTVCSGACVNLTTDPAHCGSCDNSCLTRGWTNAACAGGTCVGCGDGVCAGAESAASCAYDCQCGIRCCDGATIGVMPTPSCDCRCQASASGGRACENSGHCGGFRWRLGAACEVRATACPAGCRAGDSCPDFMYSDPPQGGNCGLPAGCCTSGTTCTHSATCCM